MGCDRPGSPYQTTVKALKSLIASHPTQQLLAWRPSLAFLSVRAGVITSCILSAKTIWGAMMLQRNYKILIYCQPR